MTTFLTNTAQISPPPTPAGARLVTRLDLLAGTGLVSLAIGAAYGAWQDSFRLGLRDEELSYVLLAPAVLGCLAWARRGQLARCRLRGGWVGLLILLGGWTAYSYGYLADPVFWRAGAVAMAIGALISCVGSDVLVRFAPVFAGCVFLIPVLPNGRYHVAIPLETATAHVTQLLCDALGMNLERTGNLLTVNGIDVTVAEACNGMRMVITLFMVCYVVAFTSYTRSIHRAILLLASPIIAIAANVVRLVSTVWMFANRSEPEAERFHDISGWVMTALAFLLLIGFGRLARRWPAGPDQIAAGGGLKP